MPTSTASASTSLGTARFPWWRRKRTSSTTATATSSRARDSPRSVPGPASSASTGRRLPSTRRGGSARVTGHGASARWVTPIRPGARADDTAARGFWWLYVPLRFDEYSIIVMAQERPDGYRTLNDAKRVWADGRVEQLGWPLYEIDYRSGTRHPESARPCTSATSTERPSTSRSRPSASCRCTSGRATATPTGPTASGRAMAGRDGGGRSRRSSRRTPRSRSATSITSPARCATATKAGDCSSTPASVRERAHRGRRLTSVAP